MREYRILTDGSCDLAQAWLAEHRVTVLPLYYSLGGSPLPYPGGASFRLGEFYSVLRGGAVVTTSAPSIEDCKSLMRPLLEAGYDLLYTGLAAHLSGMFNVVRLAAMDLKEEFPGCRIAVLDSNAASLGLGLLIAVVPSIITGDWAGWIHKALVCLVASCPCSIVISVPLSYYAGIGACSKVGMLIKGGRYLEALAGIKSLALDKTGTVTDNQIAIKEIKAAGGHTESEVAGLAAAAEAHSAHPIANAFRSYCEQHNISVEELKEHQEISGHGVSAKRGADTVTVCKSEKNGISVQINGAEIGFVTLKEHIREEAPAALSELKGLGVEHIAMLSGDKEEACRKVAEGLPIDEVHSGLLPEDKVGTVQKLIGQYGSCCFVGDGINDAPVLSSATCGAAMGLGSDAAIESADMVLSSESLSSLPRALRIARKTLRTVKANITFSLLVKAVIIVLAIVNIAPLWLAVFSDTGVCLLCVLNAVRLIRSR